jgi:methionine-rich copper-binding protein CopC
VLPGASDQPGRRAVGTPFRARIIALLVVALTSLAGGVATVTATAPPAEAHDSLVSTAPADGATVAQPPTKVVLTFDEPALALGTAIVVTSASGQQVQAGAPSLVDNTVTQPLQPGSPAGAYTVIWRVTSADGHPISGRLTFDASAGSTVARSEGATAASSPAAQAPAPAATNSSGALLWVILLGGLALVAVVLVLLRRSTERREP